MRIAALGCAAFVVSFLAAPAPGAHAQTRPAAPIQAVSSDIVVSIARGGRLFVGDRAVAPHRLAAELRRLAGPNPRILLRADRRVGYADVKATLDRLSEAGLRRVALIAAPSE